MRIRRTIVFTYVSRIVLMTCVLGIFPDSAWSQNVPNIGFESVGGAAPLVESLRWRPTAFPRPPRGAVPASGIFEPTPEQIAALAPDFASSEMVGPHRLVPPPDVRFPPDNPNPLVVGTQPGSVTSAVEPLPVDIFTTDDFYRQRT